MTRIVTRAATRATAAVRRAPGSACRVDHAEQTGGGFRVAGCRVAALLAVRGVTLVDVAARTGHRPDTVRAWCVGTARVTAEDAASLAVFLRVPLAALADSGERCAVQYVRATCAALPGYRPGDVAALVRAVEHCAT